MASLRQIKLGGSKLSSKENSTIFFVQWLLK